MNGVRVWVEAAELLGPGLPSWDAAKPVLAGATAFVDGPVALPAPAQLSPAERRRAIPSVRLALAVASGAAARSGCDAAMLASVFASSGADGETIGAVLSALALPEREVSPTRFHNSVHNAPSGYWSLAVRSMEPAVSLSGFDGSFAAGLLEAAVQAVSGGRPVLLVAYDLPYPAPLDRVRPIGGIFGVALVLAPARSDRSLAAVEVAVTARGEATPCLDPGLERTRRAAPAARSLPLLAALAAGAGGTIHFEYGPAGLDATVLPC